LVAAGRATVKALLDRWEKAVANMVATIMTTKDEMSDK
jgi:hypothetical protein